MTFFSFVLFDHVTAMLGLCAALSFEVLSLLHLRRVSTSTEARRWIEPVPALPLIGMGSIFVVFFSGVYLAMRMSAFGLAWPRVTVGALLLIVPLGAMTGRRMRAIRRTCADDKAINSELRSRLQDPFLKVSLGIRIGRLSWHRSAHDLQAGIVGVDHHCGNLCSCWSPLVPPALGSRRIAVGS